MKSESVVLPWSVRQLAKAARAPLALTLVLAVLTCRAVAGPIPLDPNVTAPPPVFNTTKGIWVHTVTSPYQTGSNGVEVLLPTDYTPTKRYPVVYVLPVEPGTNAHFKDWLPVVQASGYADAYQVICVQPRFTLAPWYGDHATNPSIRHASYMTKVVVPLIEQNYSTLETPAGRLLLGFSKSGWGAFSLLMRNPDIFGFAASWDSPMLLDYGSYATGEVFADTANFDDYSPEKLVQTPAPELLKARRLLLLGENLFGSEPGGAFAATPHTLTYHNMLTAQGIPHLYEPAISSLHEWSAAWVKPAFEGLMALSRPGTGSETLLLSTDFSNSGGAGLVSAPSLDAGSQAGKWVLSRPRNSAIQVASGNSALLMEGQSRSYILRYLPATPFKKGRKGSLSFKVAVKNGYGTATSGYGRNSDNFIVGIDENGNALFKIAAMGWDREGRLAYHNADGSEVWLGNSSNNLAKTSVYNPDLMRTVRVDFEPGGFSISLQGTTLATNVPYFPGGGHLCELAFSGETVGSSAYFDDIQLTTESSFASWQREQFPGTVAPEVVGPRASPAGDRVSNLEKFATGLPAMTPAASTARASLNSQSGRLAIRFQRNPQAFGVTYSVRASSDLLNWETIWTERNPLISAAQATFTEEVSDTVPMEGTSRRFLRLVIDQE